MSSSDSPPNSSQAVRNLRAKFEEHPSSSPTRGRSPTTSRHTSTDGSNASQTRNTVRTSFVAMEAIKSETDDRRITPEACTGSTAHKRRESFSMDERTDFKAMAELRGTISSELERRRKSALIETVPEVAVVTPAIERGESEIFPKVKKPIERPSGFSKQEVAGNDAIESDDDSSRLTFEVDQPASKDKTPSSQKQGNPSPEKFQESNSPNQEKNPADEGKAGAKEPTTTPGSAGSKSMNPPSTGGSGTKRKSGPSRVSATSSGSRATTERTSKTASGSSSAKDIKSPMTPSISRKPSTRDSARPRPLSQINKSEGQHTTSASSTGRARAWTKSPTRPVKLPQSATAPTASSAAKTSTVSTPNGGSRPGPSRTPSGTTQNNNIRRQPSKREQSKPVTSKGASSSSVGDHRALPHRSVDNGVPKRQPSTTQRNTSSEGFLARMMRPTVSSASKVHEKLTNAPKSGPSHERTTLGKSKQTDQRKEEPNNMKKPARSSRSVSERTSGGRERATENKEQVSESKEQASGPKEQVSGSIEQVAEGKEQTSETGKPQKGIAADGNMLYSAPEEPAVTEDDAVAEKRQGEQIAESTQA